MKFAGKRTFAFLAFLAVTVSADAQSPREPLQQMVEQLQKAPDDDALRLRILKLGQSLKPAPAPPDPAARAVGRALFLFGRAKSAGDYLDAAKEYELAIAAAPWVVNYYSDLCTIYEKAGKYAQAKRNCDFALAAAVDPALVVELKQRIAGLELGIERFGAASCDVCPEMVVIPAGRYRMGGTREITIARAFEVGKTEVTFAQWDACVADGGCGGHKPDDRGWGRGNQPVMNVSWNDAKQYVEWLSKKAGKPYRLLTEAEWEYAARAGTTTAYYWGDSDADICQYASVNKGGDACGAKRPGPVGTRKPNAWGLYDMSGSMWEWVEDCWNSGVESVLGDGAARTTGDCGQRVQRGGSWNYTPDLARSVGRNYDSASGRYNGIGFRVARTQ